MSDIAALVPYKHTFSALGSPCAVEVYAASNAAGAMAIAMTLAEVERIERKYSRYDPGSFTSAINRAAEVGGSIDVDDETASLLDYAAICHDKSGGCFDITAGLLRRVWHFASGRLPDADAVTALLPRIGWRHVVWTRPTLRFTTPGMEIDFGGIGKEYAVDRVAGLLLEAGFTHGIVDFGGDMAVLGPHPGGTPWRIGLRHTQRLQEPSAEVLVTHGAIATSGDYERCIEINGRRYAHLLDPRTGWPIAGLSSVSVLADTCMLAGGVASIAMLKGAAGVAWLAELGVPHWWADMAGNLGGNLPSRIDLPLKR